MDKYVLFSCIGSTDPVRDNFDGPMLHIIRHFRPHAVYIFLSQEMGRREEKDRRYSRAVRMLCEKLALPLETELIFSGLENPQDFDAYIGVFRKYLEEISTKHPDSKILLNVSSGTPQMLAMLCLETVVSSRPMIPVQVLTPAKGPNESRVVGKDYDVVWEFENNLDNDPDAKNRCQLPDILSFKRTLAAGQVQALISRYNYGEAARILRGFGAEAHSPALLMLEFAESKKNLEPLPPGMSPRVMGELTGYPAMDRECLEICEYLNGLKLLQKTGHLTDFVLRLNPLVTELQGLFLQNCLGFSPDRVVEKRIRRERNRSGRESAEKLVRRDKIETLDPTLMRMIDERFDGFKDGSHLNIRLQNVFIEYLLRMTEDVRLHSFGSFLKCLEKLNQGKRNDAAHNLCGVTEEEIRGYAGISSEKIVEKMESLIKLVFQNRCKEEIFDFFDSLNKKIILEVERVL